MSGSAGPLVLSMYLVVSCTRVVDGNVVDGQPPHTPIQGSEACAAPPRGAGQLEITIGDVFPDSSQYALSGVTDLATAANGDALVLVAAERTVRVFNKSGGFERDIGREGRGPGEFVDPVGIATLGDSLIAIFDRQLQRLSGFWLDGSLAYTHMLPVASPTYGLVLAVGAIDSGVVVLETYAGYRQPPRPGVDGSGSLLRVRIGESRIDSLITFDGRQALVVPVPARPYPIVLPAPFARAPHWAAARGMLAFGRSDSPWIHVLDTAGRVRDSLRLPGAPEPVSSGDIARYEAAQREIGGAVWEDPALRRAVDNALRRIRYPTTWPWFSALLYDACGRLWVQRARPSGTSRTWDVFDAELRHIGQATTPTGLLVRAVNPAGIWGTRVDTLGVVRVQRYAFAR